jgi:predicted transcriptional regulator
MVGNQSNFTKIDILRCFVRFSQDIGRQQLSNDLFLGEGTIRSILNSLKSNNLLKSSNKGHFLSKQGIKELGKINSEVSAPKKLKVKCIYPEFKKIAIRIKKAHNLKESYKLRDLAVKNGAEGALILKFDKRLAAPDSGYKYDYSEFDNSFEFMEGDILIVAFSKDLSTAEIGAYSVAIEISPILKKFISIL